MERFCLPDMQPFATARQIACRIRAYGITSSVYMLFRFCRITHNANRFRLPRRPLYGILALPWFKKTYYNKVFRPYLLPASKSANYIKHEHRLSVNSCHILESANIVPRTIWSKCFVLTNAPDSNNHQRGEHQYDQAEITHGCLLKHNTFGKHVQVFDKLDTCLAV